MRNNKLTIVVETFFLLLYITITIFIMDVIVVMKFLLQVKTCSIVSVEIM